MGADAKGAGAVFAEHGHLVSTTESHLRVTSFGVARLTSAAEHVTDLIEAARDVIASASDTYKKRNDHLASFQDDNGGICRMTNTPNPGCECPVIDSGHGLGDMGGMKDERGQAVFVHTVGCPVHYPPETHRGRGERCEA